MQTDVIAKDVQNPSEPFDSYSIGYYALKWASKGIPVFPCREYGDDAKKPYTIHGFKDASSDPTQIIKWWKEHPTALIGVPTGPISDLAVIDIDMKKGKDGIARWKELCEAHNYDSEAGTTIQTWSGGQQKYFKARDGFKNSTDKIAIGIDTRGDGGYVIVPPSSIEDKSYSVLQSATLEEVPVWFMELLNPTINESKKEKLNQSYTPKDATEKDIQEALEFISSDCSYQDWLNMGMALHSWDPINGLQIWNSWSFQSSKYKPKECEKKWKSFSSGSGINIGTLFFEAKKNGYKSSKKVVDHCNESKTTEEKDTRLSILKTGVLKSDLCRQVFAELKKKDVFFRYGGGISKIIEVEKLDAKTDKSIKTAILEEVTTAGFITDIEKYFIPQTTTDKGNIKESSFNESDARIILKSNDIYQLSEICGFTPFKLPYRKSDKLLFTDVGYNSDKQIYTELFAPMIEFMEIDKARNIVRDLFSEFCFLEHELDLSRAVSYILSPALTLLTYNRRAMCFLADGNREGVGKDYLLGIPYLIYENTKPIFSAPCNSDDEYRKFLFAACADNQKIIIFSNLKGYLDSKAFEHFCTSQVIKDRVLCESKNREYPNTGLYGMSGNGVSFSPDMERRIMHIRLEYYQEQITDREFKRNLYDYISSNRHEILNAIYTLIKHWFDNGAVLGKKIPSFEDWSSVVSGILISNGFKNPFDKRKIISHSLSVGGNTEDSDIKQLVLSWWKKHNKHEIRAEDLRFIATDLLLFRNLDLETKAGQITFSRLITKRADRIYDHNRIKVLKMEKYTKFYLEEDSPNGDKEDKED